MRARILAVCLLLAAAAQGAIYESDITSDSEEELLELEQRGEISEDTAETLMELLREGVDLNSAAAEQLYDLPGLTYPDVDAILEYRKSKGRIDDPTELVAAGALTEEQLIQIAPFIRIDAARPVWPVGGKFHAQSRFTTTDNVPPPTLLTARLRGPLDLSGGFMAFTTRRRAAKPLYDETTDALKSAGFSYTPHLPRFFLQWKPGQTRLVVGTFTIGFAERLTLDNTRRITPRGIYLVDDYRRENELTKTCKLSGAELLVDPTNGCDLSEGNNLYITPDYHWREVFRGVAGSVEDMRLGEVATMSLYGFASYQQRSLYQYELYDRRSCEDPSDDKNSLCRAPPIYLHDGTTRLVFSTLGDVFDELTTGGHLTFKPSHRFTFGATSFASVPFFTQQPMQLDFQEYSRYPTGGTFGAVGIDAKATFSGFNFFLEGAHNFDGRITNNKQGGWGVEQRTTFGSKHQAFELSLRLYDTGFGTPYARPIASPDLLEGQRARNEAGARFRWAARWSENWTSHFIANFWVNPYPIEGSMPAGTTNLYALARLDFTGWTFFQPAVLIDIRNKNLASTEHGTCASGTIVLTEGAPLTCGGDFYKFGARIEVLPRNRYFKAALLGSITLRDDYKYRDRFRVDAQASVEFRSHPTDFLQFRLRSKYLNEDTENAAYLETSWWSFLEAVWIPTRGTRIGIRYDLYVWLDQRASTANRIPNPEHRFQLDLRTSF